MVVGVCLFSARYQESANAHYMERLRAGQPLYQWTGRFGPRPGEAAATRAWDRLQAAARCCGIEGPRDWDPFRPAGWPEHSLPSSCCAAPVHPPDDTPTPTRCTGAQHPHSAGCLAAVRALEARLVAGAYVFVAFNLLLAGLACCVAADHAHHAPPPPPPATRLLVAVQPAAGATVHCWSPPGERAHVRLYPNASELPEAPPSYGATD